MSQSSRLAVVFALNVALVVGLVVVGASAHSLGVFAEGVDYLADAAAIAVSLLVIRRAERALPGQSRRAPVFSALLTSGWLIVLSVLVIASAVDRLAGGVHKVAGFPVLIASAIAAVTMTCGALVLRGDADEQVDNDEHDAVGLNVRAVLLDTASDAATAAGVAVAGAVILAAHGLYWLDPAVALVISLVIAIHAVRLFRQILVTLQ